MRRKSNWDKGYDFEEGRQARKHRDDLANSMLPFSSSRPSRSSGSSGGGGGSGLAGIGIGGVVFLFFVLLCLWSLAADTIDSLVPPSSNEIAAEKVRMEKLDIENSICRWMDETNLRDEFLATAGYGYGFRLEYYTVEDGNIWAIVHAAYPVKNRFCGFKLVGFKMYSTDAGDSWEIRWKGDIN
jgi:hypothetical protein